MADKYHDFESLAANEREGVDFVIRLKDRNSAIVVIAPHGGSIERGTSEIAEALAGDEMSFYSFEGCKRSNNRSLHITSTRFDEPRCLNLIANAKIAIAMHGRKDKAAPAIWLGGLNSVLIDHLSVGLEDGRYQTAKAEEGLAGRDARNICNRATSGAGAQLEIPPSLRAQFLQNPRKMQHFTDTLRNSIQVFQKASGV